MISTDLTSKISRDTKAELDDLEEDPRGRRARAFS